MWEGRSLCWSLSYSIFWSSRSLSQGKPHQCSKDPEEDRHKGVHMHVIKPVNEVLLLLPNMESKLLSKCQGPYEEVCQVRPVNYEIRKLDKKKFSQVYHVKLLKLWKKWESLFITLDTPELELGPQVPTSLAPYCIQMGEHLCLKHRVQMRSFNKPSQQCFPPSQGRLISYITKSKWNLDNLSERIPGHCPPKMQEAVKQEVQVILEVGVIEEFHSEWWSPFALVPKLNGTVQFCTDFKKINAI